MSDNSLVECPDCGTPGERQMSAGIGFVFKGSGFYETDYKRAGKTNTEQEAGKSEQKETATADKAKSDKPKVKDKPKAKDKPKTGEGS